MQRKSAETPRVSSDRTYSHRLQAGIYFFVHNNCLFLVRRLEKCIFGRCQQYQMPLQLITCIEIEYLLIAAEYLIDFWSSRRLIESGEIEVDVLLPDSKRISISDTELSFIIYCNGRPSSFLPPTRIAYFWWKKKYSNTFFCYSTGTYENSYVPL